MLARSSATSLLLVFLSGIVSFEAVAQTAPQDSESSLSRTTERKIEIKGIEFFGNTAFSEEELTEVAQPWIGKMATFEDLINLRSTITNFYIEHGYATSGAYLPPQSVKDGVVTVQIVEGKLNEINIDGIDNPRMRDYIEAQTRRLAGNPISEKGLLDALRKLERDSLFDRVSAELSNDEGASADIQNLDLTLAAASPWVASFQLDNDNVPNSGALGATFGFANQNLIGWGDRLEAGYLRTEGVDLWNVGYSIPFNSLDGTFSVGYRETAVAVTNEEFAELGIAAEASIFSVGLRQPLINGLNEELALGVEFDLTESETSIAGVTIGLDLGTVQTEGESKVRALRFSQEYLNQGEDSAVYALSRFSIGLDIFNATRNTLDIDSSFFHWLGQVQHLQELDERIELRTRIAAQLSPDTLLPVEQLAIGGISSVRGFESSSRSADNAIAASAELQFLVFKDESLGEIAIAPFVDLGGVWNNDVDVERVDREVNPPTFLASVGIGLQYEVGNFFLRANLGLPLAEDPNTDIGQPFSFQLMYSSNLF